MKKYFGQQTQQALENFPFPHHRSALELIYAIVEIKKEATLTHIKSGEIENDIGEAIGL